MKKFQIFLITALLTAFAGQAWGQLGAAPKVYGTVYAYPTIGGGQVVITESKATPSDGDFKGDLPDTVDVNASNTTKTFYLHAKAFVGSSVRREGLYAHARAFAGSPVSRKAP